MDLNGEMSPKPSNSVSTIENKCLNRHKHSDAKSTIKLYDPWSSTCLELLPKITWPKTFL